MKDLSKSIDFLLENAGPVIQYRLRKEILQSITAAEEERLLNEIYQTPYFKLVQGYVKPSGYIGSGMHSWDNWRGVKLHETPLQDGETAARLLSYYAIPKTHPIVVNFVAAMRDEGILREEFAYIPPEIPRFKNRFLGINSGYSLMILIYTMQALLGYGDEYAKPFQKVALEAFRSILPISSLDEITMTRQSRAKCNYPYIEESMYYPCQYHLESLAYTNDWRTPENIKLMADALNHYNMIRLEPDYTKKTALDCDLTFWAVQFLYLCGRCGIPHKSRTEALWHRERNRSMSSLDYIRKTAWSR